MQETQRKMKLVKKLDKNNYLVMLNDEAIKLHVDTIVKYNLLNSDISYTNLEVKELDDKIRTLIKIDKYFIKYPKSIKEASFIIVNKFNISEFSNVVDRLISFNILNDDRLKSNIIESLENRLYGPLYIRSYLLKRGLDGTYNPNHLDLFDRFDRLLKENKKPLIKQFRYLLTKGYFVQDVSDYFNNK